MQTDKRNKNNSSIVSLIRACGVLSIAVMLMPMPAWAISDEIQVYTDDINEPGERGLELHVNTTPRGRNTPGYPGELPAYRGLRVTPEFSWGLTKTLEAGFYLPMATSAQGDVYLGGAKVRLKWLPIRDHKGWYLGANGEISNMTKKFSESRVGTELRVMVGYRTENWLFGMNPILGWDLSPGYRGSPDATMTYKVARKVGDGISLGAEYYDGMGKLNNRLPLGQQDHTFYLVMDYDRKPWVFNFGIGHGLNSASDSWTVKAIFELPFN